MHFNSSEKSYSSKDLLVFPVLVGVVDDVAQSSCKCSIELNFRFILVPGGFVHIGIYEGLHRINVKDVSCDQVFGVWEDFRCQRQVHFSTQVHHLKQQFPVFFVLYHQIINFYLIFRIDSFRLKFIDLCLHELVSNLSKSWEVWNFLLEHIKDHSSLRWTKIGCTLLPVIETQILKVFLRIKVNAACSVTIIIVIWVVSSVGIWSLSLILFGSPNLGLVK